ncbi:MAG TPA: hypothetical protein VMS64_12955 [Candidatus Methylomirabilis sp.]|nr:hypothetical protein [Candidatus Methylomirabilis sp.]
MPDPTVLERLVSDVVRQIRARRAEYYGLRGVFFGALAALVPLLFREILGPLGVMLAGGALAVGGLAGALYGIYLKLPASDAARLADRGYGLQDRVATALEWSPRSDRSPMVDVLVTDAIGHVERASRRWIIPRRVPREARFIPLPLAAGFLLAVAPPIPLPQGSLPNFSVSREEEDTKSKDRAGELETSDRPKGRPRDIVQRGEMQERNLVPRTGAGGPSQAGDLSAIFKDTSLGGKAPDFNSFLKKGDERIRMLEQVDRLPDLQQDYTQRETKVIFQRAKSLRGGLDPSKVSPEKLRELLNEMERLGRKGGGPNNWSGDVYEGMEALEGGQTDKAMEAMERALSKMRAMDEKGRDGKSLRGGRESERRGGQRGRDRGNGPGTPGDEGEFPEGEGLMPGRGKSANPKGDPTQRLRANPYDVGVEGESRPGRKQGLDTNMVGRGANMPSRLQYLGVLGQYRKMMEESIAREQVPRDFQAQVKEYFQALDEK